MKAYPSNTRPVLCINTTRSLRATSLKAIPERIFELSKLRRLSLGLNPLLDIQAAEYSSPSLVELYVTESVPIVELRIDKAISLDRTDIMLGCVAFYQVTSMAVV
jgi:hypothetical protein